MAGTAKPIVSGLKQEAQYTHIGGDLYDVQTGSGLFDGTQVNEWNTNKVAYWNAAGTYVEVDILSNKVNIWRSGTTTWPTYTGAFVIKKWNESTLVYDDVTSSYPQAITAINETQWEKTISDLPKGKYRFEYSSALRMDSEWYIELNTSNKTLIFNGGEYKKYDDATTSWVSVSTTTPTQAQFESDGMDSIPDWSALSLLAGNIEVVTWTDEDNAIRNVSKSAIPQDQLVQMTRDINIRSIENIDSFSLNTLISGQAIVKTAVSFDSGVTWYTRSGTVWAVIPMDLASMKADGMTPAVLNALTTVEWTELRGTSDTVRFAYLLSAEEVTDTLEVRDLVSQMDMRGTWKKAAHPTIYDYEYPFNDQLRVTIFASGDYKINY
ncbi:hypothetical protein BTO30_13410 [Domibacillus antri]|uniref:Uncharacterized protein n=1 Tax=Domibacillus antri TaxID=1714264 RepID=A0A1Q8Q329_9BACI|nr:hypothetical protein [Domibacillus antri]OLN21695.1 hypothetical protein BTO30_13410 [Domibacillus antri]